MNLSQALAIRIFDLCIKYNKTIYELSKDSGMPKSTLRDLATARYKNIRIKSVEKISKGLGMSIYDFFDDEVFKQI